MGLKGRTITLRILGIILLKSEYDGFFVEGIVPSPISSGHRGNRKILINEGVVDVFVLTVIFRFQAFSYQLNYIIDTKYFTNLIF